MAPASVTACPRQMLLDALITQLKTITIDNGYNTQPAVTNDGRDLQKAGDVFALWVSTGPAEVESVGDHWNVKQTFEVYGYAPVGYDTPDLALNKILQDTMTALTGGIATIVASTRAIHFEFGTIETDQGELLSEGWASFVLPLMVTYIEDTVW